MLNIAICDDEEGYIGEVDNSLKGLQEKHKGQISIYYFNSVENLLQRSEKIRFDCIFLDIRLEKENFQIAQKLVLSNSEIRLFFLSDYEEHAFESFTYNPLGIIRKSKLSQDMEQVIYLMDKWMSSNRHTYEIIVDRSKISIDLEKVMYIDSQKNYLIFYMHSGETYKTRMTVKQLMTNINTLMFYRINAGCVINLRYLQKVEKRRVYLDGGMNFSIGRKAYPEFYKCYKEFIKL